MLGSARSLISSVLVATLRLISQTWIWLAIGAFVFYGFTQKPLALRPAEVVLDESDAVVLPNVFEIHVSGATVDAFGSGEDVERPDHPGYQFLVVNLTYRALAPALVYDRAQWTLLVDRRPSYDIALTRLGPRPELLNGTLAQGQEVTGNLIYEVPPTGDLVMYWQTGSEVTPGVLFEGVSGEVRLTR